METLILENFIRNTFIINIREKWLFENIQDINIYFWKIDYRAKNVGIQKYYLLNYKQYKFALDEARWRQWCNRNRKCNLIIAYNLIK